MSDDTTGFVPPAGSAVRAEQLLFDLASSKKDWSLPEDKALFSKDTAIRAMLAFAASPEQPASEAVGLDPTLGYSVGHQHAVDGKPMQGSSPEYEDGYAAGKSSAGRSTRVDGDREKPVAWRWEGRDRAGYWTRNITAYKPDCKDEGDQYCRNVEPLYLALAHPAESANCPVGGEALREALAIGERFLNACNSAWAAGEPSHRVKTMLDMADKFSAALNALESQEAALAPAGAGDVGALTEAQFVSALSDALVVAYRRAGGITRIARSANGAAAIRNIATLEAAAIYREALSARKDAAIEGEER
jgi:hypothetical protein